MRTDDRQHEQGGPTARLLSTNNLGQKHPRRRAKMGKASGDFFRSFALTFPRSFAWQ